VHAALLQPLSERRNATLTARACQHREPQAAEQLRFSDEPISSRRLAERENSTPSLLKVQIAVNVAPNAREPRDNPAH